MVHMDNPEKAQYDVGGIVGHGGVDVAELLRPSSSERYALIREMIAYVRQENCRNVRFDGVCDGGTV